MGIHVLARERRARQQAYDTDQQSRQAGSTHGCDYPGIFDTLEVKVYRPACEVDRCASYSSSSDRGRIRPPSKERQKARLDKRREGTAVTEPRGNEPALYMC